MEYNCYKIVARGKSEAGPCNIEAPSPGSAIDYFLAIHGMLGYDITEWCITDEAPDETRERFDSLMLKSLTPEQISSLDAWHLPHVTKIEG